MPHRIKPQNTSMGHVFQHFFSSGFMPIHNQCFRAKHTFVQKGDYGDMCSSRKAFSACLSASLLFQRSCLMASCCGLVLVLVSSSCMQPQLQIIV